MTDLSSADRYAWRTSADYRDEETRSDAMARSRAAERNAGWVRPFTAAAVILLNVLVIYWITVHGSSEGTRFYADRA